MLLKMDYSTELHLIEFFVGNERNFPWLIESIKIDFNWNEKELRLFSTKSRK